MPVVGQAAQKPALQRVKQPFGHAKIRLDCHGLAALAMTPWITESPEQRSTPQRLAHICRTNAPNTRPLTRHGEERSDAAIHALSMQPYHW